MRLAGIEPTTPWFVAKYSIQLSYSREKQDYSSTFADREAFRKEKTADHATALVIVIRVGIMHIRQPGTVHKAWRDGTGPDPYLVFIVYAGKIT